MKWCDVMWCDGYLWSAAQSSCCTAKRTGRQFRFADDDRLQCLILVRWLSWCAAGGWEGSYLENQSIDDPALCSKKEYLLCLIGSTNICFGFEHKTRKEITEPLSLIQLCCWLFRNLSWTYSYLKYTNSSRASAGASGKQIGLRFVQLID